MFKTRQSADTWAAWSSDSSRTLVPPLWIDPGEQSSLHLVEHSLTAPTKRREDWRVVRRLVGVGNRSLIRKAKAACPSRMGKGTDSQLPISMQVSKCFPESCASARTWLKKWKTNAIATNVPPSSLLLQLLLPSAMPDGTEQPFGQFGSAVEPRGNNLFPCRCWAAFTASLALVYEAWNCPSDAAAVSAPYAAPAAIPLQSYYCWFTSSKTCSSKPHGLLLFWCDTRLEGQQQ